MNSNMIAAMTGGSRSPLTLSGPDGVVEIGLLLPTNRAAALLELARDRRESVGQLLRCLIDRELTDPA